MRKRVPLKNSVTEMQPRSQAQNTIKVVAFALSHQRYTISESFQSLTVRKPCICWKGEVLFPRSKVRGNPKTHQKQLITAPKSHLHTMQTQSSTSVWQVAASPHHRNTCTASEFALLVMCIPAAPKSHIVRRLASHRICFAQFISNVLLGQICYFHSSVNTLRIEFFESGTSSWVLLVTSVSWVLSIACVGSWEEAVLRSSVDWRLMWPWISAQFCKSSINTPFQSVWTRV